jgi:diguanylate cyclase (GGDEF)-like protein
LKRTGRESRDSKDQSLLRAAFDRAPQGCALWDESRRLVFFNHRYLELLGALPGELRRGMSFNEVCEVAIAHAGGSAMSAEALSTLTAQRLSDSQASGQPVEVDDAVGHRVLRSTYSHAPGLGWIVMHWDVTGETEQQSISERRKESLDLQSRRFKAALDNMSHGLSIFDAQMRLVICNRRYLEIFALSADQVHAGTPLRRIAELRRDAGTAPPHLADFVDFVEHATSPPERFVETTLLQNGRSIQATRSPIEGGGFVAVHQDITEEIERLAALDASHVEVAIQKRRFEAALANMSHGLSKYDADGLLVTCNDRYLEMFGLSREFARPGTPFQAILEHRRSGGAEPLDHEGDFGGHVLTTSDPTQRRVNSYRMRDGRVLQVTQSPVEGGGFVAVHEDITTEVQRLDALKASSEEIAIQKLRFEAALASMPHGLSLYDAERRLITCNQRYREIYDAPEELCRPGTRFEDVAAYRKKHGSAPIPRSDEFVRAVLGEDHSTDQAIEVFEYPTGQVILVRQAAMADGGIVRIHQDITTQVQRFESLKKSERSAAEKNRVLKRQNMRFDAAVNNMSQGLCMFDKHEHLVVCNEPYARIYNLPPDLMRPGTTLRQILDYRFAHGMVPRFGRDRYVDERKRLVTDKIEATDEVELEDGRTISIHHHPMKGGGWVATHEDVTEQRRTEARVRHLARHDALTDLPNRAVLKEEMRRLELYIEGGETVAVFCVDLDHFTDVNDTLGHGVGDQVLIGTAERLTASARESDLVIRLGGDEFAVIASGLEDPRAAALLAERMVKSIAQPMIIDGSQVQVGASIGIAFAPGDGSNAETLLKNADMALYRAKGGGRGTYHFFERGMDEALQNRRLLEQGLKVALARGELRLMYQPLLDLPTSRICCFEALLRWDHPTRGVVSPAEFIPVAEDSGLIGSIGEWVLREACRTAAGWPEPMRVAVNLSPAQFRNRNLVDQVVAALSDAGLPAERLELEVTESLLLAETEQTLQMLHQLRAQGVHISMDDFGTGYSSLSYLRAFPFDKIKIDRSFIAGLNPGDESIAIVRAIIALGQSLGMSTTAEGIETEAQLNALREQGCNEAQGFLLSPPLPASAVLPLLGATSEQLPERRVPAARRG